MKISKNSKGIGWEKENDINIDGGNIDLTSYAKKSQLPTKTSQLTNDSGFITEVPSEYITETELNAYTEKAKTSYIDSTRDLEKLYNALGEKNNNKILVKKVNSDRYDIYIHHFGDEYQQHRFTRESTVFDSNVPKHENGDVFNNELATLVRLRVQKNIPNTDDNLIKSGTWTSSVANSIYSTTANDYIEATFYGTECRLDVYSAANSGICRAQIDGQDALCNNIELTNGQCLIDTYGSGRSVSYTLATNLLEGYHTVRITVTGEKNESSSDGRIYFQNIRYWQSLFSEAFALSQIITNDTNAVPVIPSIVKELAISVDGAYRGFYHRYCYPKQALEYEIYIDGVKGDINIGEYIICNNVQFKQTAILYDKTSDFAELITTSNYNSDGIIIKNKFTALRDFNTGRFYPAMSGFYCQKVITSNCGERELLKDETIANMSNDTSSILSINKENNYIGYTKFLYCSEGVIDNPYTPHFFSDRTQGYAKIYFVNNKQSFEKGYSYESIVRHSIKKCFSANML